MEKNNTQHSIVRSSEKLRVRSELNSLQNVYFGFFLF